MPAPLNSTLLFESAVATRLEAAHPGAAATVVHVLAVGLNIWVFWQSTTTTDPFGNKAASGPVTVAIPVGALHVLAVGSQISPTPAATTKTRPSWSRTTCV